MGGESQSMLAMRIAITIGIAVLLLCGPRDDSLAVHGD
jgi:hypothetical protein